MVLIIVRPEEKKSRKFPGVARPRDPDAKKISHFGKIFLPSLPSGYNDGDKYMNMILCGD
jgi:hypothetical protein